MKKISEHLKKAETKLGGTLQCGCTKCYHKCNVTFTLADNQSGWQGDHMNFLSNKCIMNRPSAFWKFKHTPKK